MLKLEQTFSAPYLEHITFKPNFGESHLHTVIAVERVFQSKVFCRLFLLPSQFQPTFIFEWIISDSSLALRSVLMSVKKKKAREVAPR